MGAAFCIYRDDYDDDDDDEPQLPGVQCSSVYAASGSSVDTKSTYWFPEADVTTILAALEDGTLDIFDAAYDTNIISDNYEGMTHFEIG